MARKLAIGPAVVAILSVVLAGRSAAADRETKTFVSETLGVALDYPSDWTVREDAKGATFSSLQGFTIRLTQTERAPASIPAEPLPNTRCSSRSNPHGLAMRVCLDTVGGSRSAEFSVPVADGSSRSFLLSMVRKGDLGAFNGMIASARPVR